MKLMQPIIDVDTGNIIVLSGQVLTEELIKRLKKFKDLQVWVEMSIDENSGGVSKTLEVKYQCYTHMLKNIMEAGIRDNVNIEELRNLTDDIMEQFKYSFDILGCINLIKNEAEGVYKHSLNVTFLSLLMGRWQGFKDDKLRQLVMAGLVHDIGKLDMKDESNSDLQNKIQYRKHPIYSYERLRRLKELDPDVLRGILTHHERCDGSGFPLNVKEEHINDIGRILGLADTYDELKEHYNIFKVIQILRYDMIHQFDTSLLLELCNNVANYYIGMSVLLSTGEVAEVILIHPNALHRPLVKVGERYLELINCQDIQIEKVL